LSLVVVIEKLEEGKKKKKRIRICLTFVSGVGAEVGGSLIKFCSVLLLLINSLEKKKIIDKIKVYKKRSNLIFSLTL